MPEMGSNKKYFIIDTDCGVDDALALMLAFDCHKKGFIEVLGITCVYGNVNVDKVVRNVLLTRRVCGAQNIKVFRGAECPILETIGFEDGFFGDDGLGNSTQSMADINIDIESENAVNWMIRQTKLYPKQITLLTLGPLTNVGLSSQLDPGFFDNLGQIISMGGLLDMFGNVSPNTEFNFFNDPDSVHMVLTKSKNCPLSFCTWDMAYRHRIPWKTVMSMVNLDTEKAKFIGKIYQAVFNDKIFGTDVIDGLILCDILCIIAGLFPEWIVRSKEYPVSIELRGQLTRGQLVVGRTKLLEPFYGSRNVTFIKEIKLQNIIDLIIEMINK